MTNLKEVEEAVCAKADIIMFDNMSPEQMRRAVKKVPARIYTEASAASLLRIYTSVAETGVKFYFHRGVDAFFESPGYQPGISTSNCTIRNKQ